MNVNARVHQCVYDVFSFLSLSLSRSLSREQSHNAMTVQQGVCVGVSNFLFVHAGACPRVCVCARVSNGNTTACLLVYLAGCLPICLYLNLTTHTHTTLHQVTCNMTFYVYSCMWNILIDASMLTRCGLRMILCVALVREISVPVPCCSKARYVFGNCNYILYVCVCV